jgi:KUP system potassium uptake protein
VQNSETPRETSKKTSLLVLAALGVVYGDIGTSPLYALRECFSPEHGLILSPENIISVVSLIIWSLVLIVSIKYLTYVLKADNRGEGGVLALMALALQGVGKEKSFRRSFIVVLGLLGAALLYGDGTITPAISVLSAVEGLKEATPVFEPYITTITIAVLLLLFALQREGSGIIGRFFGPVILLWFVTLAVLGLYAIPLAPQILSALNPIHGVSFLLHEGMHGFLILGAVFLAVTGAEALYADMGHFGRRTITIGWLCIVFPALILNYLGQGALIISDHTAALSPFYKLAGIVFPKSDLIVYLLVALATTSTVIASQALISGAFSLTSQAVQLGYLPRLQILHTSSAERGQIYVPLINWALLSATIILVLSFHSSTNLAAAYGIAVSTTMVITTVLVFFVAKTVWRWQMIYIVPLIGLFIGIDLAYFFANALKIHDGGWVPLVMAGVIFVLMTTWWRGRQLLWMRMREHVPDFREFFSMSDIEKLKRVPGSAVFLIRDLKITPPALIYNLRHNRVVHDKVILFTVVTDERPFYPEDAQQVEILDLGSGFYRVILHCGFMERADVPEALREWCAIPLAIDPKETVYFLDRVNPIPTKLPGMAIWREHIFAFMSQIALRATTYYQIPADQVIEIGYQVEI